LTACDGYVIHLVNAIQPVYRPLYNRFLDILMSTCSSVSARVRTVLRGSAPIIIGLVVSLCLPLLLPSDGWAKAKQSRAPRPEPELKVLDVQVAPIRYTPGDGPLQFSVTVQLPRTLNGATILEVTSLISSPSKTSLRFLTHRQPVEAHPVAGVTERPKVSIELSWDGQDHRKQLAGAGVYSYEVRTKLLKEGDKGLRTMMVAWPKRGTLDVE